MQYINDRDYEYIKNKYHDTSKPYNSFARFVRHDEIFSEDTGVAYEDLKAEFTKNDAKISHLSHRISRWTKNTKRAVLSLRSTKIWQSV